MTTAELNTFSRYLLKIDSTATVSDDQLLLLYNIVYPKLQRIIADLKEDFFGEIATADLVKDQLSYGLPDDYLKIKRIEVAYEDPTETKNWIVASPIDIKHKSKPWNWYRENQSESDPIYDIHGERVFLAPDGTDNETAGVKIWYLAKLPALTTASLNTTPIVFQDYHHLIALGAVVYVATRHKLSEVKRDCFALYQTGIREMKEELKETVIGSVKGSTPNEGDNGYNF